MKNKIISVILLVIGLVCFIIAPLLSFGALNDFLLRHSTVVQDLTFDYNTNSIFYKIYEFRHIVSCCILVVGWLSYYGFNRAIDSTE